MSETIGGGWLGTYAYRGLLRDNPPVRFEATLTEPDGDGRFTGTILDDGALGEADVNGRQSGLGVQFTKVYHRRDKSSISYEGALAEDGLTMQGSWRISRIAHGIWDARRAWSHAASAEETEQNEPRIREAVRF